MSMTESTYTKDEQTITVALVGAASAGGSFLSSLAEMGMMSAGSKMRLGDYTAVMNSEAGSNTLSVSLESSGTLTFESHDASRDALMEFAEAFPIAELDKVRE